MSGTLQDPSALTTDQLRRELASLREILEARLNAIDKATTLFEANLTRVPTDTDKQIAHLQQLHDEKFSGVQKQFMERDTRAAAAETAQKEAQAALGLANTTMVNAAFAAQKDSAAATQQFVGESAAKSEAAVTKQIDGILTLLGSNTKAIDEKISGINSRLDRGDGGASSTRQMRSDDHMTISSMIGIVGGAVGIFTLLAMVVFGILNNSHSSGSQQGGLYPYQQLPATVPNSTTTTTNR